MQLINKFIILKRACHVFDVSWKFPWSLFGHRHTVHTSGHWLLSHPPADRHRHRNQINWKHLSVKGGTLAAHNVEWGDKRLSQVMAWCLVHWTPSHWPRSSSPDGSHWPRSSSPDGSLPFNSFFLFTCVNSNHLHTWTLTCIQWTL